MSNLAYILLFLVYPYICLAVFLFGSIYRYKNPYTVTVKSSQLLSGGKLFIVGNTMFHFGIIIVLSGHFFGFLTPLALFDFFNVTPEIHQAFAAVIGGIAGIFVFVGLGLLLFRRLFIKSVFKTSSYGDILVLVLLLLQVILGLSGIPNSLIEVAHRTTTVVPTSLYFQGIVTFNFSAYEYAKSMSTIYLIHTFLGFTLFLVFPFTRLIHVISAPLDYLFRKGYQIVIRRKQL